jgi:hypothetical protein
MSNLFGLVSHCHFVEYNSICPYVNRSRNPRLISQLGSLIVLSSNQALHKCQLSVWVHYVTETKVTNFCDWALVIISLLLCCLAGVLEDQNVVDFYIRVDYASLVDVPEAS